MPEIIDKFSFEFYDVKHVAYLADNRHWYVRLDHLCEQMGLDARGQRRRIQSNDAIKEHYISMQTETEYQGAVRMHEVGFLDLEALPFWLGMIELNKVSASIKPRILLYQKDFVRTVFAAYRSEMFSADLIAEMDATLPEGERTMYELMAQFQALRRKVEALNGKMNEDLASVGLKLGDLGGRIERIEAKVVGEATIYPDQAQAISQMITAVGTAMFEAKKAGKAEAYSKVQMEFKREFGVHIYSALPMSRFGEAIEYLRRRWQHFRPGLPLPDVFRRDQKSLF